MSASEWERDQYVSSIRQAHDDAQASLEAYLSRVMTVLEEVLAKNARQLEIIERQATHIQKLETEARRVSLVVETPSEREAKLRRQITDGVYILALLAKINGGSITVPRWALLDSPNNLGRLVREDAPDGSIVFTLKDE